MACNALAVRELYYDDSSIGVPLVTRPEDTRRRCEVLYSRQCGVAAKPRFRWRGLSQCH